MRTVRIGTRASALARWQTEHVLGLWRRHEPALAAEIVDLSTVGDELAEAPLERMEGTGFFTSTLERALLEHRIDVAVHSFKDLPVAETPGLVVAAIPARGRVEDALCAREGVTLATLPVRARVGTSSVRRTAQLYRLRTDLRCVALRGNVPTRLERVARGELDAVVLAVAGLERLDRLERASEVFTIERMLPAPAQGALAIQARADDAELRARLAPLDQPEVRTAVLAERDVLHRLHGGCSVPVGAHARLDDGKVRLDAGVFDPATGHAMRVQVVEPDARSAGEAAARALLALGAGEVLAALDRAPRLAWDRS